MPARRQGLFVLIRVSTLELGLLGSRDLRCPMRSRNPVRTPAAIRLGARDNRRTRLRQFFQGFRVHALMALKGLLEKVHARVDECFEDHLRNIQEYLRQPSVAITGEGIPETAEMTAQYIKDLGGWARVERTKTHPIVRGGIMGATEEKILRVDMYDVQPPEPLDEWVSPPWAAEIRGDRIIARGASNNKGPLRAYFNALKAILEVEGELPCSVDFLIEGEEEIGSYALPDYVMDHKAELAECKAIDGFFPSH